MEERLDDAINVLKNHCEPQVGTQIANIYGSAYVEASPVVNTPGAISQDNVTNEPPATVKLERVPLNSSKEICALLCIHAHNLFYHFVSSSLALCNHFMRAANCRVASK